MIPRVFHRIWLDEDIPEVFEGYWRSFQVIHPGWEFVTWSDSAELGWITNRRVFDAQTTHAGRSDVLRYEILAAHGGVYVDTDVEPLRPFTRLLDGPPFAGWEDANMICPTVMGSAPRHPATADLVAALTRWATARRRRPPNQQTGPHFLTARWRDRTDVRLFGPETFYPVHWSDKASLGGPYPPQSYAVHHWAAGWLPNGPPQRV